MVFRYMGEPRPIGQFRHDMDRFVSGMLDNLADGAWPLAMRPRPAINFWEDVESLHVELELPGVKHDQLELSVVGNELSIKIERPNIEQEGETYHRRERNSDSFARVVRLPADVDADRVEAELERGILSVTLPKTAAARPRKIQVGIGTETTKAETG